MSMLAVCVVAVVCVCVCVFVRIPNALSVDIVFLHVYVSRCAVCRKKQQVTSSLHVPLCKSFMFFSFFWSSKGGLHEAIRNKKKPGWRYTIYSRTVDWISYYKLK